MHLASVHACCCCTRGATTNSRLVLRAPVRARPRPLLQVTQLVSRGPWSSSQLREGLELAMGGCAQLDAAARQCLKAAAAEAAAKQQQQQQAAAAGDAR